MAKIESSNSEQFAHPPFSGEADLAIAVHGGAWDIRPTQRNGARDGCVRAADAGYAVLEAGGTALDAVQSAIVVLEDDPVFDAGRGSFLNTAGNVEMDALLMRGSDLQVGAVAAVTRVPNPVLLARAVLESDSVLIAGDGTTSFAQRHGIPTCDPNALVTADVVALWKRSQAQGAAIREEYLGLPSDTVGAVARDRSGRLAAGASTGGLPGKVPGRVGDVPVIGAGVYADDLTAAVAATGTGEAFMRVLWAYRATRLLDELGVDASRASRAALGLLTPVAGQGGLIMIDRLGRIGTAFNTPAMAYAWIAGDIRDAGPSAQLPE